MASSFSRTVDHRLQFVEICVGNILSFGKGGKKAIITYGRIFANAYEASKSLDNTDVIKLNKIYPLSNKLLEDLQHYEDIYFFEEGIKSGGVAQITGNALAESNFKGKYKVYAIDNKFVGASTIESALKRYYLDTDSMIKILKG